MPKASKATCFLCVCAALFFVVVAVRWNAVLRTPPMHVRIATGTERAVFEPLGQRLAQILSKSGYRSVASAVHQPTMGSLENIDRLLDGGDDGSELGFVADLSLLEGYIPADAEALKDDRCTREDLRTVARLYDSYLHVVARSGVEDLTQQVLSGGDGRKVRVFPGPERSATRCHAMKVLNQFKSVAPWQGSEIDGFEVATDRLLLEPGEPDAIDVAFYETGYPADSVIRALKGGCRLLSIPSRYSYEANKEAEIPAYTYEGQEAAIKTERSTVYLLTTRYVSEDVVADVLDALFRHQGDLIDAHPRATDIRIDYLSDPTGNVRVGEHPGVEVFRRRLDRQLLIATRISAGKIL